jgi:hypothetical protein
MHKFQSLVFKYFTLDSSNPQIFLKNLSIQLILRLGGLIVMCEYLRLSYGFGIIIGSYLTLTNIAAICMIYIVNQYVAVKAIWN